MLAIVFAGCNEEPDKSELTFADIEDDFSFPRPLSEISKSNILEKWGSIELYYDVLSEVYEKKGISNSLKKKIANTYQVTLFWPNMDYYTLDVSDNEYILDAAEDEGCDLPYSCRAGACSTCAGRIIVGYVDQCEQVFLNDSQVSDGFVLLCVAYPTSNSAIMTNCEDLIY